MKKVAILGPGLLGGSIALALQAEGGTTVHVWARREEAAEEVRRAQIASVSSTDLRSIVENADVVVLCTPTGAMPPLARELSAWIPRRALVTDVGSVKAEVVNELTPIFAGRGRFIGSHPMAGSEQQGLGFARSDLFEGSVCILTPDERTHPDALPEAVAFWRALGCEVRELSPGQHDQTVAMISHFPHLLAASLVHLVATREAAALQFVGPGFRDTTRVASGPPEMWAEILRANREPVHEVAEAMIEKLNEIIRLLGHDSPDHAMREFLTQAKEQRDGLRPGTKPRAT